MGLEKRKAIGSTIDSLVVEDQEVNSYEEVLNEIRKFYKGLFSKKDLNDSDTESFLEGLELPKISESEKNLCDQEITIEDLKESMLSMSEDKSPGNDGISTEFYNYFWEEVGI